MTNCAIPSFTNLSRQEIFDKTVSHIGQTRKKSQRKRPNENEGNMCVYSGIGCAASVFLQKKHREALDNVGDTGWSELVRNGYVPDHENQLVRDLQVAHDQAGYTKKSPNRKFIPSWKEAMKKIAEKYKLSTAKLDAIPNRL